jgi:hypothetical protein
MKSNAVSPETRARLGRPLIPKTSRERLARLLGEPDAAGLYGVLTVGDFLYDLARIDPLVLEAADFASAADIGSRLTFAEYCSRHESLSDLAEAGSLSRLKGYVAERVVAQNLAASGHDVSLPGTANNEGWDLLVDGREFQVKCVKSASAVREHLAAYPGIPVIVNAELAEALGETPGVYVDPTLSLEAVTARTSEALEGGAEVLDFEIPWTAFVATTVSHAVLYSRGLVDLQSLPLSIGAETAGRVTGGALGKLAGTGVGLLLFGPAGGVIGALAGAVGGGMSGRRLTAGIMRRLAARSSEARARTRELAGALVEAVTRKIGVWEEKVGRVGDVSPGDPVSNEIRSYVLERAEDEIRYFRRRRRRLEQLAQGVGALTDPLPYANDVLTQYRRAAVHPHEVQKELRAMLEALGGQGE